MSGGDSATTVLPARSTPAERRRAVRAAATLATDAVDLAALLAALGLDPKEGKR